MANEWRQRQQKARETRPERYREQLASGELVIRQMMESERAYWNERSAAADRHATPEERERRALRANSGVGKLSATQPDSTRGERTRFDQRSRWHITRTRLAGCLPPGRVSEGGEGLPIRPEPLA